MTFTDKIPHGYPLDLAVAGAPWGVSRSAVVTLEVGVVPKILDRLGRLVVVLGEGMLVAAHCVFVCVCVCVCVCVSVCLSFVTTRDGARKQMRQKAESRGDWDRHRKRARGWVGERERQRDHAERVRDAEAETTARTESQQRKTEAEQAEPDASHASTPKHTPILQEHP